jgi:glycosyltransferase involved in cell wall biosynthesis
MTPRLLIIGYVWPEPKSSAAGSRMLQLIRIFLDHRWQITFASPANAGEHRENLTALGIDEQPIELNHSSFDVFIQALQPQVVLFDRFMMEEQFGWRVEQHCPNALRILNTEDLHSLRDARHQQLKQHLKQHPETGAAPYEDSVPVLYDQMAEQELTLREVAAILRCDLTLMISEFETELLQQAFQVPKALLMTLPFVYDSNSLPPVTQRNERQDFVFIGNFRHAPNWDAVLWLKQRLWPQIRLQLPQAKLQVYGAYPAKKVTQLHNAREGFYIRGWAKNAWQVLGEAKIALAPLRFGAGIKGKLAESMLCGTPSVTTPFGSEGMLPPDTPTDTWPGAIADNETDFVHQAVSLYQDPLRWQQAQQRALNLGQAQYCQARYAQTAMQRIIELQAHLAQHRKTNFIGLLLRHHHHKSTQYMAQWIEAKNRH